MKEQVEFADAGWKLISQINGEEEFTRTEKALMATIAFLEEKLNDSSIDTSEKISEYFSKAW